MACGWSTEILRRLAAVGGETLDQRNARLANIIEAADRAAGGKLLNGHKARINTPADLANMNTDPKAVLAAIEAADKAAAQQGGA